jgi:hypothetical protein
MAAREYIKLTPPRRTSGFAVVTVTRSNLWLGSDHLLCVETEGFNENYRRFYFRDIQAITLRRTQTALVFGVVTGAMTALFAGLTISVNDMAGKWFLGIMGVVCGIPFLLNLFKGPTCQCELRTAVQTEKVPSMNRVRRARRVISRLRPLIAEAQGQISPEDIAARFRERIAAPGSEPPVAQPTVGVGGATT